MLHKQDTLHPSFQPSLSRDPHHQMLTSLPREEGIPHDTRRSDAKYKKPGLFGVALILSLKTNKTGRTDLFWLVLWSEQMFWRMTRIQKKITVEKRTPSVQKLPSVLYRDFHFTETVQGISSLHQFNPF